MTHADARPLFLAFATGLALVGLGACAAEAPRSSAAEAEIREAVRVMLEDGWSRGESEAFRATMADTVRFHYAGSPVRLLTREDTDGIVGAWRAAFPDLRMELEDMVVEGDMAAARVILTGTHEGPWAAAEPTGERVRMALMFFMRFEDGRMVELWESDDQLGLRRQLGLIP